MSHTFAVPSNDPVTALPLSVLMATEKIESLCPDNVNIAWFSRIDYLKFNNKENIIKRLFKTFIFLLRYYNIYKLKIKFNIFENHKYNLFKINYKKFINQIN